jgi:HAD superfamily hydrolase (TIGR01509 family)
MTDELSLTAPPAPSPPPTDGQGPAAVLWDMDGTLVDTEPFWFRAETELVTAHGGTWTDADARELIGFDLLDAADHLRRVGGVDMPPVDIVNLMMDRVIEQMADQAPWQPGAVELLEALVAAGIANVLVTMSWRRLADAVVGLLPPGSFVGTVTGDEVARGKPHPDPYLAAAALVGAEAADCVAIEDSPTGARSAHAAGCFVLAVPHVVDVPAEVTHTIVPSLTAVDVPAVRRLLRR